MDIVFLVILTFIVSCFLTGLLCRYAFITQRLDLPNFRSSHTSPTPRGGGLGIVIAFFLALSFFYFQKRIDGLVCLAMAAGGLIAFIGWVDDCGHVGFGWRLLVHAVAVVLGLYCLGGVPPLALAGWAIPTGFVLQIAAGFCLVWLLNLINFMDGIDGLAAMEVSCVALGAAVLVAYQMGVNNDTAVLFVLGAASLGFLVWNWPPASIFMGDVGSCFLGYILGMAAVLTVRAGVLTLPVWLILLAAFWVDATLTLICRMAAREKWWTPHCGHAYQCAARRYNSHRAVDIAVLAINVFWLLPLAFCAVVYPSLGWLLVVIAVIPLLLLVAKEKVCHKK